MLNSGKQGGTSLSLSLRQLHTLEQGSRLFHEPLPQLVADQEYILDAILDTFSLQSFFFVSTFQPRFKPGYSGGPVNAIFTYSVFWPLCQSEFVFLTPF